MLIKPPPRRSGVKLSLNLVCERQGTGVTIREIDVSKDHTVIEPTKCTLPESVNQHLKRVEDELAELTAHRCAHPREKCVTPRDECVTPRV